MLCRGSITARRHVLCIGSVSLRRPEGWLFHRSFFCLVHMIPCSVGSCLDHSGALAQGLSAVSGTLLPYCGARYITHFYCTVGPPSVGGGCPRPTIQKTAQRLGCAASSKLSFCQQELIPYLNYPAYPHRYQLQVRSGHRSGRPPCCPVQRCRRRYHLWDCRYRPRWNPGCSAPTPAGHRNW